MPARGYRVYWRVVGSGDPYTDAGNFFTSPAVFMDETNPAGTEYEGTITSQLHSSFCAPIAWSTIEDSGSGSGIPSGSGIQPTIYGYYEVEVYSCLDCSIPIGTTTVAAIYPVTVLYKYYNALYGGNVVYRPIGTSVNVFSDYMYGSPQNTCVLACEILPE